MLLKILASGAAAASFAYLCNKLILSKMDRRALITLIPFVEELSKSYGALFFNVPILSTHFIFGCIEGIYDMVYSSEKTGKLAALVSLLSHSFFGAATYLVYNKAGSLVLGIAAAWILHSTWNWYIMKKV